MIELLSKPIDDIALGDIQALIDSEVPEGEQIEFKKELPGDNGRPDPWMEGRRIGNYAKDRIVKEVLAFANAYGGALIIGIDESGPRPAVAAKITPVPRCADLAESLKLVLRDRAEPQLARVDVTAIQIKCDGAGVVIIRVGKSRLAPHRDARTRICPIRHADRSEEMSMREIQDMTINMSRGLELLEKRLAERSKRFSDGFGRPNHRQCPMVFGARFTAVPVIDEIQLGRVFLEGDIVGKYRPPKISIFRERHEDRPTEPRLATTRWYPLLRGTRAEFEYAAHPMHPYFKYAELHSNGLVELSEVRASSDDDPLYIDSDLIIGMFANLAVWADLIRKQANAPTVEYALAVEIRHLGNTIIVDSLDPHMFSQLASPKIEFPTYPLNDLAEIRDLLGVFCRDLWNSIGRDVEDNEYSWKVLSD